MDIFTQGLAGAALAQTGAYRVKIIPATIVGFLAGMLADSDVLIRSESDPLLNIEFHRQFTHSLLFIPIGALIISLLLWPLMRKHLNIKQLYFFSLLGYCCAGLLDACTSFGTQLLWPFSTERIAWNLISIIDPLFTIGLLIAVIAAWKTRNRLYSYIGIFYVLSYLGMGYIQHHRAETLQFELAQSRGHNIEKSVVKPTLGNIMLWRSVYQHGNQYYVDAIRPGLLTAPKFYNGHSIPSYNASTTNIKSTRQQQDLSRFNILSQGYLVQAPQDPQIIGDIRYAMLPDSIEPLWGIRLDPGSPDRHVSLETFRKNDEHTRKQYLRMLFGQ